MLKSKEAPKIETDEVGPTVSILLDRRRFDGRRIIQVPMELILEIQGPMGLAGKTVVEEVKHGEDF